MSYKPVADQRPDRYKVSTAEYAQYQKQGFPSRRALGRFGRSGRTQSARHGHAQGPNRRSGSRAAIPRGDGSGTVQRFTRVHQLHRWDATCERFLLHPRVLDVLEALIGPDVLALQTMQFFNAPGMGGQGWHQDSYYITTYPDTLIGAWLALERADEENGCLWVAPGSNHEPIYPDEGGGHRVHAEGAFDEIETVEGISHLDDEVNTLSRVARRYGDAVPVVVEAGDVVFFHPHLLHRSHPNQSPDRWRRAFVSRRCNARGCSSIRTFSDLHRSHPNHVSPDRWRRAFASSLRRLKATRPNWCRGYRQCSCPKQGTMGCHFSGVGCGTTGHPL